MNVLEKIPAAFGKSRRTINIRTLVILNTDEDKEERTIFIKKAVIDPSISRDSLRFKISSHLFEETAKKFESQIDQIHESLAKIQMFHFPDQKVVKSFEPQGSPSSSNSSSIINSSIQQTP